MSLKSYGIRVTAFLCLAVLVPLSGCSDSKKSGVKSAAKATEKDKSLAKLFDEYWEFQMQRSPERATYLGDHRYDDKLRDYSKAAREEELTTYRRLLKEVKGVRREKLSDEDRLSAELFELSLASALDMAQFPEYLMPIEQQEGPQITIGMLQTYHPFNTPRDCANYAARLHGFRKQVDDMIALMDEGIKMGVVRPKITIEQSIPQLAALITDSPAASPLYAPTLKITPTAGAEASRFKIEEATRDAIASARKLKEYLEKTYLPRCRDTVGYGALPNGKQWYIHAAKYHTTTDMSPEKLHQLGLDELTRIHDDMRKIMTEVGFQGDLQAFIEHMRNDPKQQPKNAAEIMRRHREILTRSDANLPKLFGKLPKIPYDLKEMEPFRAAAAPDAYYYNAPDDGSRPAYFYINTFKPETRPIFLEEALAYHEAMPGHHLQLALVQERTDLPKFRRFEAINAFIEGWALYSEVLGYDLGGYRDPYSRFGQLTFDAWRASRLVVDTGMHYMGWTRQQAIDFMKKNTGLSEHNIVSEVDRYIAWPGQALAYKAGQLEILKLRDEARATLGAKFDIRAFHDHLLAEGSMPLSMLQKRMEMWIVKNSR